MANGFFLGGMAEGITRSRELGQRDRALGLEERALAANQAVQKQKFKLSAKAQADEAIAETLKAVSETIKGAKQIGRSNPEILKAVEPLVSAAVQTAQMSGRDPQEILARVQADLLASPGPEDVGKAVATKAMAEAKQVADSLGLKGADREGFVKRFVGGAAAKPQGGGAASGLPGSSDLVDTKSGVPVLKNEVSNSIRGATAALFGGTFNPLTGEVSGLDPEAGRQALDIAARAEELILAGEEVAIGGAVRSAIRETEQDDARRVEAVTVPSPAKIAQMTPEQAQEVIANLPDDVTLTPEQVEAFTKKLRVRSAPNTVPREDGL